MSDPLCIVMTMTNKVLTMMLVAVAAMVGVVGFAAPAEAAVSEQSRLVVIDLPAAAEGSATALVKVVETDGDVWATKVFTSAGNATVVAEEPEAVASVTVKVGARWVPVDGFVVTATGVAVEAYGQTVGVPFSTAEGVTVMLRHDGTVAAI